MIRGEVTGLDDVKDERNERERERREMGKLKS